MGRILEMKRGCLQAEYDRRSADLDELCLLAFERGFLDRACSARSGVTGVAVLPVQIGGHTTASGMAYARGWRAADMLLVREDRAGLEPDVLTDFSRMVVRWLEGVTADAGKSEST